jgi:hypothetical protein
MVRHTHGHYLQRHLVLACVALLACPLLGVAGTGVPKKSELRARVAQLYATSNLPPEARRNAFIELSAPLERECMLAEVTEEDDDQPGEPETRLLSWKIVNIRTDSSRVGEATAICSGKSYRIEAGARVTIAQVDQELGSDPTQGELTQVWVLVGGVWYIEQVE